MSTIDITGLDKVEVLRALYAHAKPMGLGILHYVAGGLSQREAEEMLENSDYFDYVKGRVMKVRLGGDYLDTRLYDRDNGQGMAELAVNQVRALMESSTGESATPLSDDSEPND